MKLNVVTGEGVIQEIIVNGVAVPVDRSGTIIAADEAQDLMDANAVRGGWFVQNLGSVPLLVCEIDEDAAPTNSFQVQPLATFPPAGFPVTVARISIRSSEADAQFIAREW